jgi:hypothetical protein
MQLTLSEADFERMSPELRRSLLNYIGGAERPKLAIVPQPAPLDRSQATALLREISFHRDGKVLHAMVRRLAYKNETEPPTRHQLADALPSEAKERLPRHLAALNRIAGRLAKPRGAKLWRYRRAADAYVVHPATRKALRDLIPVLARSGKSEEPLWEG